MIVMPNQGDNNMTIYVCISYLLVLDSNNNTFLFTGKAMFNNKKVYGNEPQGGTTGTHKYCQGLDSELSFSFFWRSEINQCFVLKLKKSLFFFFCQHKVKFDPEMVKTTSMRKRCTNDLQFKAFLNFLIS